MASKLSPKAQELARKASRQGLTGKSKPTWEKNSRPLELYSYTIDLKHTALYEQVKEELFREKHHKMNIKLHILEIGKNSELTTPEGKTSVVIPLEESSQKKVKIGTTQGQESYWVHEGWRFELKGGESIGTLEHNVVVMLLLCTPKEDDQPQVTSGKGEAGTTERAEGMDEGCGVNIGESRGEGG